jgi:uncharacterized protein
MSDVDAILVSLGRVAVLGAHPDPSRPAHYVPAYLVAQGIEVRPVNPAVSGRRLFGHAAVARLTDLEVPIDLVDVFRRKSHLAAHVPEILAMDPLPRVVWLQSGIRHEEVARRLESAGIEVVQDRCLLVEHRRFAARRA